MTQEQKEKYTDSGIVLIRRINAYLRRQGIKLFVIFCALYQGSSKGLILVYKEIHGMKQSIELNTLAINKSNEKQSEHLVNSQEKVKQYDIHFASLDAKTQKLDYEQGRIEEHLHMNSHAVVPPKEVDTAARTAYKDRLTLK